jgi:DNA-binding LacI/PurR family transcriptional regulator
VSKGATTLADLAKLAGVSISTASRSLNDSPAVNKRTKEAIWKLARELDYPFRSYMPAGPIGADATIAIVAPRPRGAELTLSDPFFLDLFAGLGEAARARDCDILLSHVAPATFEDLATVMNTTRADGIIFLGQSTLHSALNQLAEHERRFVVWGAQLPDQRYCSVGGDNSLGMRRATLHLARLGRRRIAFLGDIEDPEPMQRHRGYLDALEQSGIPVDPQLIVPAHFEAESAESAIDSLIHRGVALDGVAAASDLMALGAIRALIRSVVGYDNVPAGRYASPSLSTISQDTERAGRLLISKLLDSTGHIASRSERVPTELIIRESCGG